MLSPKKIRHLLLVGAFGFGEFAFAGDQNPPPAVDADTAITLAARKALHEDAQLAPLNLGVSVRGGVARLWGLAPTAARARLAEERIRSVPGVREVRSDLHVLANDDFPARDRSRPVLVDSDAPAPIVVDSPVPMLPPPREKPELALRPPDPFEVIPDALVHPAAERLVAMKPDPSEQIGKLWRSDKRYAAVEFEVHKGIVRLSGKFESWNDLWPFADAVANVPGVDRVVIAKVTVRTKSR